MLPHDFMAPNRGEDANTASAIATAAAAKRAAAARSPTTHPSQIPDAFRLNAAASMARGLDQLFQRSDDPDAAAAALASAFSASVGGSAAHTNTAASAAAGSSSAAGSAAGAAPAATGVPDPIAALLNAQGFGDGEGFDQAAYDAIKAKMAALKQREEDDKLRAAAPLEDDPGSFSTMLDTTLDFFFLTPILFLRPDGTSMFEPRARDAPRMSLVLQPRDAPAPGSYEAMTPSLLFTPDQPLPPNASEASDDGHGHGANSSANSGNSGGMSGAMAEAMARERALAAIQPDPSESRDPALAGRYRPRIPPGHKLVAKAKMTYDQAYRMCPIMMGHNGPGDAPTAKGTHCFIRLPGIFAPLPVYGLPRLCAQNLIYCVQRLYRMFGCRLPHGVQWKDLSLRLEGAPSAMDPLEDVLPDYADRAGATAAYPSASATAAADDAGVIDITTAAAAGAGTNASSHAGAAGTAVSVIEMDAAAPPVLILEPRAAAITLFVTNAPRPLILVPQGRAPPLPRPAAATAHGRSAGGSGGSKAKAANARAARKAAVAEDAATSAARRGAENASSTAYVGDNSDEDDSDSDSDSNSDSAGNGKSGAEGQSLRRRNAGDRPRRPAAAAASAKSGDKKGEEDEDDAEAAAADAEIDEYYASLAAHAKSAAPPNWRALIRDYEPRRRPVRVVVDDFSKNFTLTDLKVAAAALAALELTPTEAAAITLWREVRVAPSDVFVDDNGNGGDSANSDPAVAALAAALRSGAAAAADGSGATTNEPRKVLPVSALAPSERCEYRWEPVSLPNATRLWELALDARGAEHNVFELQFDPDALGAALARAEAAAAAAGPAGAGLPVPVKLARVGDTLLQPANSNAANANAGSSGLYKSVQALSDDAGGAGNGDDAEDGGWGSHTGVTNVNVANSGHANSDKGNGKSGVGGVLTRAAAAVVSTALLGGRGERARAAEIAAAIRQRQRRRMQEVSFEKARDAGLLFPYLGKHASAAAALAEGGALGGQAAAEAGSGGRALLPGLGGGRAGWWGRAEYRNGGGWLSTPMLLLYMVLYIVAGTGLYLASVEDPGAVPVLGRLFQSGQNARTDDALLPAVRAARAAKEAMRDATKDGVLEAAMKAAQAHENKDVKAKDQRTKTAAEKKKAVKSEEL